MTKPKESRRALPIPDDWQGDEYALALVCIPNSQQWKALFLGALSTLSYGRTWDRNTGSIKEAQSIANEIYESVKMACTDEVLTVLNSLVEAVQNLELSVTVNNQISGNSGEDDMTTVINNYGCGCGCGGQTGTSTAPQTTASTDVFDPPAIEGPINQQPPPGFEIWDEYATYKCQAAHHVFDQIYNFVGFMDTWSSQITLFGLTNEFMSGIRYYWMSSQNLTSFISNMFNWAISSEAPPTFWTSLQVKISEWKPTLVCLMINAPNATQAIQVVTDTLEDAIDDLLNAFGLSLGGPVKALAVSLIGNLVATPLINDLFRRGQNIPDNTDKSCDCGQDLPTNTGVCYSMNTSGGLGQANLVSDDGSIQVWRVYPAFVGGIYKIDLKAFTGATQIAYQITDVDEYSNPPGGYDLIEYNYQNGSQETSFVPGCVDNIRYESTRPGFFVDVHVDIDAMNDCVGCTSLAGVLLYQLGLNGSNRGSGSLAPDGSERVLTAIQDSNGLYYVSFGIYDTPSALSYEDDCTPLPAGIEGTSAENFDFIINSGAGVDSSIGTRCNNDVHTVEWSPAFPTFGTTQNITWFEAVADTPFTVSVKIGLAGTL